MNKASKENNKNFDENNNIKNDKEINDIDKNENEV